MNDDIDEPHCIVRAFFRRSPRHRGFSGHGMQPKEGQGHRPTGEIGHVRGIRPLSADAISTTRIKVPNGISLNTIAATIGKNSRSPLLSAAARIKANGRVARPDWEAIQ